MKNKIKKFIASSARASAASAKCHKAAMDNCEEGSDEHEMHKAAMEDHLAHAECCAECMKAVDDALGKADGFTGDRAQPFPDGFFGFNPSPDKGTARATMIPRIGGPGMEKNSKVPLEFQKLVSVSEEE